MEFKSVIINLDAIEIGLQLTIDAKVSNTLFQSSDAFENGEAEYQLVEGCSYDYEFNCERYSIGYGGEQIVQAHSRRKHIGIISPNIYVGTLTLPILKDNQETKNISFEVRSLKTDYRSEYREMLEFITEKCTDLLLEANTPVSHNFETDFENDNETLYQKFAFIKSIISTNEFAESIQRIVTSPVTQWKESFEQRDFRNIRRFTNSNTEELVRCSNRSELPDNHNLKIYGFNSIPDKITSTLKSDTVDTPENRFVKFALETFLKFCSDLHLKSTKDSRLFGESKLLANELESFLHHSVFREISRPTTLKLNSPILQRKEGYREILRVWLMFDLAAKLVWKGGDNVYSGGKKDIATLYEYWLFFKLLDLFKSIFDIEPNTISDLVKETANGLNLQLKQGNHTAMQGVFDTGTRKLSIRFNYNRSFSGKEKYPNSGSWTTTMRPDYTLSFWPHGIEEHEAETQELIVHIHFDAKYKLANFGDQIESLGNIGLEKEAQRKGDYKNADLLKMHAYKDAIRRTGGAYVLYPGRKPFTSRGFHEIIPGLGAFPVRPSKTDDGMYELKVFILDVIKHFTNRASQREKIAYRTFDIYQNVPTESDILSDYLPEPFVPNRDLLPDNTFVLVGYYKSPEHLNWVLKQGLYNVRTQSGQDSIRLGYAEIAAKYLLLYTKKETKTCHLFKITHSGPTVFSKENLIAEGYPTEPSQNFYLVYNFDEKIEPELTKYKWDISIIKKNKIGHNSVFPFAVTLSELMKAKVQE